MSKWISVDERLPEVGATVLCYIKHNYSDTDGFRAYRVYGYDGHFVGMGNLCEVTHWMPLPEPPGEEQTNADRIRDMGDDELAQFLCEFRSCDAETHPCNKCKAAPFCRAGHTGMIDWLQSPTNEG